MAVNTEFSPKILSQGVPYQNNVEEVLVNGAILSVAGGLVFLTKATAGAFTLAVPYAGGARITLIATAAAAHVVTVADGLNGGASNTMTMTAVIGNGISLVSRDKKWYVDPGTNLNITLSTV